MKVIPDEATRLAALKGEEVDIAYSIRGELAAELRTHARATIKSVVAQAPNWIYFPEQWDPKSPWHKLQVRQAANLALDRDNMNKALFLGRCKINNSMIPDSFEYYWQPPPAVYDPAKAKKLMAEAGYPERVRCRAVLVDSSYANIGEVRSIICRRSASAPSCSRWSAPLSRPITPQKIPKGILRGCERRLRQCRDAAGRVHRQGWLEGLRQLSRHRRALPAAGQRTRPEKARGDPV